MTVIRGKRLGWINQFNQPSPADFKSRVVQVDGAIIKFGHGLAKYEALAREVGRPWLAERMGESGIGDQQGPSRALVYARDLAEQANRKGCIGAVINLEEADGGWHTDSGSGTRQLIQEFRHLAPVGMPLLASLDTRLGRPNYPYQQVCADLCDGVMPMVYPAAFRPGMAPGFVEAAFRDCLTDLLYVRWAGKEIHPTIQVYDAMSPAAIRAETRALTDLLRAGMIHGGNFYTINHATQPQWEAALTFMIAEEVRMKYDDATLDRTFTALLGTLGKSLDVASTAAGAVIDHIVHHPAVEDADLTAMVSRPEFLALKERQEALQAEVERFKAAIAAAASAGGGS